MRKKIRFLWAMLIAMMFLTSCGSSGSLSEVDYDTKSNFAAGSSVNNYESEDIMYDDDAMFSYDGVSESTSEEGNTEDTTIDTGIIDTEKLVYSGNISLNTLTFSDTVDQFIIKVKDVGGFIENSNIDTRTSYYSDSEKLISDYYATVRVPSSSFNTLYSVTASLGNVTSQSSNVENITQEYSTVQTSLEIYQAKYKRYLELLESAETVEDMIEIERELTNIEVTLADYKTRLSRMDTDVAYSYLNVSIHEVENQSEMESESKFSTRLSETLSDSWDEMLEAIEGMLFFIIMNWWRIILLAVFVFIVVLVSKKNFTSKKKKKQFTPVGNGQYFDNINKQFVNGNGYHFDGTGRVVLDSNKTVDLTEPTADLEEEKGDKVTGKPEFKTLPKSPENK